MRPANAFQRLTQCRRSPERSLSRWKHTERVGQVLEVLEVVEVRKYVFLAIGYASKAAAAAQPPHHPRQNEASRRRRRRDPIQASLYGGRGSSGSGEENPLCAGRYRIIFGLIESIMSRSNTWLQTPTLTHTPTHTPGGSKKERTGGLRCQPLPGEASPLWGPGAATRTEMDWLLD